MATITYDHTITDAQWFDATPTMGNFNKVKNALNGQLDESNFDDAMTPTLNQLETSEEISGALIEPAENLVLQPSEGKDIVFRLESAPATVFLRIDETGVTIGA